MINRGSEWARWDLHVHTKGTAKNDLFKSTSLEEFFQIFFMRALENEIKVIGITDYFNIENYKKAVNYQKEINQNNFFNEEQKNRIKKIQIIPNIELRITPTTGKGSLINIHLLFNPNIIDEFEELFLTQANMIVDESLRYSLTKRGLVGLGMYHYPQITDEVEAYKKGIEVFCLTHKDLVEILEKNKVLKENCLIFVANGTNDGVSGIKSHEENLVQQQSSASEVRNSIYRISDGLFSPKPSDLKYFLGKGTDSVDEIIRKYGALKPCIHGSDAHTESKLFKPDNDQFCWIKAEPTFEGLKQILHEPETRVHIGPVAPELKNDYEVIDHIQLNSENIFNDIIYFNPNLTSIIGGRSSGKSTLLQCLAKKLHPAALEENINHLDDLCKSLEIIWKDGKKDDTRQIEYFYQGHMYRKSKDEGVEEIVEKLLLQQSPDLFDSFERAKSTSKLNIAGELSTYFSRQEQIVQKRKSLLSMGKIEDVNAQINALAEQINTYPSEDINEQELKEHDTYKDNISALNDEILQVNSLINYLENVQINEFIMFHNPFNNYQSYSKVSQSFENMILNIKEFAQSQLDTYKQDANELLFKADKEATQTLEEIRLNPQFIKVSQFLSKSESLKPILLQKEQEEVKAKRINLTLDEIHQLESLNTQSADLVRQKWLSILESYNNVITKINTFSVSQDLVITASKIFETENFQNWIKSSINQQSDKAQSYANRNATSEVELLELFDEVIQSYIDETIKFKQGSNLEKFTKEFFDNTWFRFKYDVIYDGDNYNAMSQGKKAFVVLKMTLDCSDSKCPIIIDQPEDDLDNRAIFTELVTYLKDKKTQRQIILVTHNANVVVNADSELVVVANQHGAHSPNNDGKKFQYKYGSIECLLKDNSLNASTLDKKRIKDHICEILEGGDKAFKLREKKYNFI